MFWSFIGSPSFTLSKTRSSGPDNLTALYFRMASSRTNLNGEIFQRKQASKSRAPQRLSSPRWHHRLQLGDMLLRPLHKLDKFLVVQNVDKVWRRNSALGQIPASVR